MAQQTYKVIAGAVRPVGRRVARLGDTFTADPLNPGIKVLVAGKRIEAVTPGEGDQVSRAPETIADLSPKECSSLIAGESDPAILRRWAEAETRPSVAHFLADRLKALKALKA